MTPVTHVLKTWPEYFKSIADGSKPFEVRFNDRDFGVGDYLILQEYHPRLGEYTGRYIKTRITYVLNSNTTFGKRALQPGYVVLGLEQNK